MFFCYNTASVERWLSGRKQRTANASYGQPYRRFESCPLRHFYTYLNKMNSLIIYASIHHKNTEKIATTMASELQTKAVPFFEAKEMDLQKIKIIGFGSGVYYSKFHKGLVKLAENLPDMKGKKAFLFSTAGMKKNFLLNRSHFHFKKTLKEKNFEIIGEFDCLGWDTNGLLKKIGGLNKGRPNEEDLRNSKFFAKELLKKELTQKQKVQFL